MIAKTEAKEIIKDYLESCFEKMPVLPEICEGTLSHERLRAMALVHYAETKTFINIKNPARLYLCPHEARHAKQYFCYLYAEEQGNFREGMNHADLFKPACHDLGLTDEELEDAYDRYSKTWLHLFEKSPSLPVMVFELGVSVAWESLTPFFGDRLVGSLKENYDLSEDAIKYFTVHYKVDVAHSARAIDTLARYCTTRELLEIATNGIKNALIDDLHLMHQL